MMVCDSGFDGLYDGFSVIYYQIIRIRPPQLGSKLFGLQPKAES